MFSLHDLYLGKISIAKHRIRLKDDTGTPFREWNRWIPPALTDEVRAHLKEMLDLGVIRPSESPYSSNVVLVRKKDGSLRFYIGLRQLNSRTVKDTFDTFDALQGARLFSTLDLKSSYWQMKIEKAGKEKTAFTVGSLGFF